MLSAFAQQIFELIEQLAHRKNANAQGLLTPPTRR